MPLNARYDCDDRQLVRYLLELLPGDETERLDEASVADDERAVITFEGAELVRGGGGPRCMTCPVERDEA
jgi:arginine deiminase